MSDTETPLDDCFFLAFSALVNFFSPRSTDSLTMANTLITPTLRPRTSDSRGVTPTKFLTPFPLRRTQQSINGRIGNFSSPPGSFSCFKLAWSCDAFVFCFSAGYVETRRNGHSYCEILEALPESRSTNDIST